MLPPLNRRRFLRGSGLLGLNLAASGLSAPFVARAAVTRLTIVSNPGLENATLNMLMEEQGNFRRFGVDARIVQAPGATGPFDAIVAGDADICMVSGYDGVLSRIDRGAGVKIVGAGMKKCALTVFARPDRVTTLADLKGKTIAVGPPRGLLHMLTLALMKERKIDASQVNFVNKGTNDQCHNAVAKGEADACCASISHLNDKDGLVVLGEGNLWEALPKFVFQTAYASDAAITAKFDGIVAVMAAYGALYDYLMSPAAHDAFFTARQHARKTFDSPSAQAIWDFNQMHRPYSRDLSLTESDIDYLQNMHIDFGSLKRKQPFTAVADMSAATAAAKLLG